MSHDDVIRHSSWWLPDSVDPWRCCTTTHVCLVDRLPSDTTFSAPLSGIAKVVAIDIVGMGDSS